MGDPDEVVIKMTPLQEVAAKLPPEVGAAAQEWMTEPWHTLPILLVLMIWGTFAVSRNEWEDGTLARG